MFTCLFTYLYIWIRRSDNAEEQGKKGGKKEADDEKREWSYL